MDNPKRGLYGKYFVKRTDGKSEPGQKHENCQYFVLDITHDPFALPALRAYMGACAAMYPALAEDLYKILKAKGGMPKMSAPSGAAKGDG
jgi:hypothetical protein